MAVEQPYGNGKTIPTDYFFFPQSSQMIKSKIRQLKRKETKKGKSHSDVESLNNSAAPSPMGVVSPPDHSAETKDDGVTADVNQEGQMPPEEIGRASCRERV